LVEEIPVVAEQPEASAGMDNPYLALPGEHTGDEGIWCTDKVGQGLPEEGIEAEDRSASHE